MKKTKSFVVTLVIIIYLLGLAPRQAVFADETPSAGSDTAITSSPSSDPTSNPSPDPSTSPSPDPTPSTSPSPDPSPSPSPDPCNPTPGCTAEVTQENNTQIDNQVTASANTGDNAISPSPTPDPSSDPSLDPAASPSPDPDQATSSATLSQDPSNPQQDPPEIPISNPTSDSQIQTGNAATEVNVATVANTNMVDSTYTYHVENIYFTTQEQINLTNPDLPEVIPSGSLIVIQTNAATVNNVVTAVANSGQNLIDGAGQITTGDSSVAVNVFNLINTNFTNSSWQLVVINIFGDLVGNIILPEPTNVPQISLAGVDIAQSNNADVQNSVNAQASTGDNNLAGQGQIQTGNAQSVVNVSTYANSNFIGAIYNHLIINNFGIWNGQFLGWGTIGPADPTQGQMVFSFSDIAGGNGIGGFLYAQNENNAILNNQVTTNATTGQNAINGQGQISTGNAYSAVNIINFVNTNVINSKGFFGIINIFGSFDGNIGGKSYFATTGETQLAQEPQTQNAQNQDEVRASGGQLETQMSTNVGTHVNPGDTVTFFITAKNPGTGPVYDAKVTYNLYDANGQIATIQTFNLGKLDPGETAHISFGIVLAKGAPAGTYQALVQADGTVGPDNQGISSQSKTSFLVGQGSIVSNPVPEVFAAETVTSKTPDNHNHLQGAGITMTDDWGIYLLFIFLSYIYMFHRIFKPTRLIENLEKREKPTSSI